MSIIKHIFIVIFLLVITSTNKNISFAQQSATVTNNLTVNSVIVISDASTETSDPTSSVALSLTPSVGASDATGSANFRIRTNQPSWRLVVSKGTYSAGTTSTAESDITITLSTSAGSNGNASAGTLQYTSKTLSSITNGETVVSGTAKTSSTRDSTNTNNFFQVNTSYSIPQDFFFTPGTATITLTFTASAP